MQEWLIKVDLNYIDKRLQQLLNFDQATSYSKLKDTLRKELEASLPALPGQVSLATVSPRDICRFLIFKDKDGRTQTIITVVNFLGNGVNMLVLVPSGYLIILWIPILEN